MFKDLDKLITFIQPQYDKLLEEWKQSELYMAINLKRKYVKEINKENEILSTILNYRLFINNYNLELKLAFNKLNLKSEVNTRVKSQNSIEYKINNYMSQKHEHGEIPINKCFNDLYGIRIIFEHDVNHSEIDNFIKFKYKGKYKCIDSSKATGYNATHIYFSKDNFSFPWELQIWDKSHEKLNITSHELYKQEYIKWEKENNGGESV